jgi:hypothetical protein
MLNAAEIGAAITGLSRLLRFDAGFVNWFDRTPEGARRSFRLMLPLLPLFLTNLFTKYDGSPAMSALEIGTSIAVFYVMSWICFPLLLILIGRALQRENQAIATLSAYNWFGFSVSVATTFLSMVGLIGALGSYTDFLITIIVLASLVYECYLLNTALGVGYVGAALLAVVDFVVGQSLLHVLLISPEAICIPIS